MISKMNNRIIVAPINFQLRGYELSKNRFDNYRSVKKFDSLIVIKPTTHYRNGSGTGFSDVIDCVVFSRFLFSPITSNPQFIVHLQSEISEEFESTKKVNGSLLLHIETMNFLWISNYDLENLVTSSEIGAAAFVKAKNKELVAQTHL